MVKPIPSLEAIRADARKAQRRAERLAPPCDSDLYRHYDADTGLIADCEYEPGHRGSDVEPPVKEEMLVHRVYANGLEVDHLISGAVTAKLAAAALEQLHDERAQASLDAAIVEWEDRQQWRRAA